MFHLTLCYSPHQINYNLNQSLYNECNLRGDDKMGIPTPYPSILFEKVMIFIQSLWCFFLWSIPRFGPLLSTPAAVYAWTSIIRSKFPSVSNSALTWNWISTKTQLSLRLCYVTWFLWLKLSASQLNVSFIVYTAWGLEYANTLIPRKKRQGKRRKNQKTLWDMVTL